MRSIVKQVVLVTLVAQVLLVTCLIVLLLLHERSTRYRALDTLLQGRADSLAGAIQDAEDADANVFVDPREFRPSDRDLYVVYGDNGGIIGSSSGLARRTLPQSRKAGWSDRMIDGTAYRVREQPGLRIIDRAETSGVGVRRPITVVYAVAKTHVQHELMEAVRFSVLAGFGTCCLSTLLVTWSLRRSLRPLVDLSNAAEAIQAPPAMRFDPPSSVLRVEELSALAATIEAAVDRTRQAFVKEQRFVGDAAHELKTAVAVLRSSVQLLLLRQREPAEYTTGLHGVLQDAERMEAVVRQMLLSAEVSEAPPERQSSDAFAIAEAALAYVAPLAESRGVSLHRSGAAASAVPLSASRARVLLENLLTNAVQHSPAGTTVEIIVSRSVAETRIAVRDQGHGIGPEALPHVFERFYREDVSRARDTGGTGLGLSICKAIVESAGGSIRIGSTPGQGTTVEAIFTSV